MENNNKIIYGKQKSKITIQNEAITIFCCIFESLEGCIRAEENEIFEIKNSVFVSSFNENCVVVERSESLLCTKSCFITCTQNSSDIDSSAWGTVLRVSASKVSKYSYNSQICCTSIESVDSARYITLLEADESYASDSNSSRNKAWYGPGILVRNGCVKNFARFVFDSCVSDAIITNFGEITVSFTASNLIYTDNFINLQNDKYDSIIRTSSKSKIDVTFRECIFHGNKAPHVIKSERQVTSFAINCISSQNLSMIENDIEENTIVDSSDMVNFKFNIHCILSNPWTEKKNYYLSKCAQCILFYFVTDRHAN